MDRNFPVTVLETVMMGRYGTLGLFKRTTKKDQAIALDALTHVGMDAHRDTALGHLSGGQQQRVFIARALAQQPKVLLQVRHKDKFVERAETQWPLKSTKWTKYYLDPG